MKNRSWLMLMYSLPARPSSARVNAWRKLKALGVLYLQHSVCLLPESSKGKAALDGLAKEIQERKGEAKLSVISFQSASEESDIVNRFRAQSDEEYQEFLGRCDDFHKELAKERAEKHFTFAELEENEVELDKLKLWLPKIAARDFFATKLGEKSVSALRTCEDDFARYSKEVASHEILQNAALPAPGLRRRKRRGPL